jgi:4-hydroxy-tetrahydrodipicolinate reductase
MIKISVIGAGGRMGQKILAILKEDKNIQITAGIDSHASPLLGQKIFTDSDLTYSSDVNAVVAETDIFIDFTTPTATMNNLKIINENKKSVVIGTTGFNENEVFLINEFAQKIPIVFSPNMSIGVNVFFKVLAETAKLLKDYDTEVVEFHHNKKKDSPSGTAVRIAEIITQNTGRKKEDWIYGREGIVGERKNEEIAIHAVRLGDIVGEHTVYFCGNNERIELTHRAHSRDNFASGAVKAGKWLFGKEKGLYDMFDVLGLK